MEAVDTDVEENAPFACHPQGFVGVAVVCARAWGTGSFSDVVWNVSSFIPIDRSWSLEVALSTGNMRLLRILLGRPPSFVIDKRYVAYIVNGALDAAAKAGILRTFEEFGRYFPDVIITHAADIAARHGQLCIVNWLLKWPRVIWRPSVFVEAVQFGTVSGVKRLLEGRCLSPDPSLLVVAVTCKHVNLARWLWYTFAAADDHEALERAIEVSDVPMATWMVETPFSPQKPLRVCVDNAASRGDLVWLDWSRNALTCGTTRAMDDAASNGHLDVVKWLHQHRSEGCTAAAVEGAAKGGYLSIVEFLCDIRGEVCTEQAVFLAAVHGQLDVLQWFLRTRTVALPPPTFDKVAEYGQLDVITWLTESKLGVATHRAMDWAAGNGHLGVVSYLHDNRVEGCSTAAMDRAASNGHYDVVAFLRGSRLEGCTSDAFDFAAKNNHRRVVNYLSEFRPQLWTSEALLGAAQNGHTGMVRELLEIFHFPLTTEVVDAATASGSVDLVEYLYAEYDVPATQLGIDAAVQAGHFDVLAFLQEYERLSCWPSAVQYERFSCSPGAVAVALSTGQLYLASWAYSICKNPPRIDTFIQQFVQLGVSDESLRAAFR